MPPELRFVVVNHATATPVIDVGTPATLDVTLTNATGADITLHRSAAQASTLVIALPSEICTPEEVEAMTVAPRAGWRVITVQARDTQGDLLDRLQWTMGVDAG